MARARSGSAASKEARGKVGEGEFVCPECGRSFTRAASLGAHRNRAHGVAGKASQGQTSRGRRTAGGGRGSRASGAQTRRPTSTRRGGGDGSGVNRDVLLQTLFPNGVPPREDVIRSVNAWLDEADRLAATK